MPKPSQFNSTDPVLGTEWVIIEKGGTTYKVALSRIKDYADAAGLLSTVLPCPSTTSSALHVDTESRIYALRIWVHNYMDLRGIVAFGGPNGEEATDGTNNAGAPWGLTDATGVQTGTQGAATSFYHHITDYTSNEIVINDTKDGLLGDNWFQYIDMYGLLVPAGWKIEIYDMPNLGGSKRYTKNGPVYFRDYISSMNHGMDPITYDYSQQSDNCYYYMKDLETVDVNQWIIHSGYAAGTIREWDKNKGSFQEADGGYSYKLTKIDMPTIA